MPGDLQAIVPRSGRSAVFDDGSAYSVAGCGYEDDGIDNDVANHARSAEAGKVSIYPNPVTDVMTVTWPEEWSLNDSRAQVRLVNLVAGVVMIDANSEHTYFNSLQWM